MKQFTEKQKEIIQRFNTILEYVNNVQDWLDIAYTCAVAEMENPKEKLEKILTVALKENEKLYNHTENLWCDFCNLL